MQISEEEALYLSASFGAAWRLRIFTDVQRNRHGLKPQVSP
jgi:hypothetical protein